MKLKHTNLKLLSENISSYENNLNDTSNTRVSPFQILVSLYVEYILLLVLTQQTSNT